MNSMALGLIEVKGYLGAVLAADAALKAANVRLVKIEKIKGALTTVMLTGDVGAVSAAVDAGASAVTNVATLVSSHVIPRMHEETEMLVLKTAPQRMVESVKVKLSVDHDELEDEENVTEILPNSSDIPKRTQQNEGIIAAGKTDPPDFQYKSVQELRTMVRRLKFPEVKPASIKHYKKEELVNLLTNHYREEDK
jgi:microcompartment protein CcmL/EutN